MDTKQLLTIELPIKIEPTVNNDGFVITDTNEVERFFYEKEKGSSEMIYDGVSYPAISTEKIEVKNQPKEVRLKKQTIFQSNHKLTNKDIKEQYPDIEIYAMKHEFTSAFAYWVIAQNSNSQNFELCIKAIEAYSKWLNKKFRTEETVKKLKLNEVDFLTSSDVFESIPEILALNEIEGEGMVALGALSRNIYYHILRNQITQPLD